MAISIIVHAANSKQDSTAEATGFDQHTINSSEKTFFLLGGSSGFMASALAQIKLSEAIRKFLSQSVTIPGNPPRTIQALGPAPTGAWLCSPTDKWGGKDLYESYSWDQVQVKLEAKDCRIVNLSLTPVIVATAHFKNESSKEVVQSAQVTHSASLTTESNWSQTNGIEVSQSINYGFKFPGLEIGGETTFSYSHTWQKGGSESKEVSLQAGGEAAMTLHPGESGEAHLTANKGELEVEIVYELTLSGMIAVNFKDKYDGHHFWAFDVNAVFGAAGIETKIETKETIKVGFYSDINILTTDSKNATSARSPLNARPGV